MLCSSVGRCVTATIRDSAYRHIRIISNIMFWMLYISRTLFAAAKIHIFS